MFLDSSVAMLISLKNQKIQKTSITSDCNIKSRDSQDQQNISFSWFSFEQSCTLGKKLRYPLPRHSFNSGDLSAKMNIHENIGSKKFNDIMNLAKTWKWKLFQSWDIYNQDFCLFFQEEIPNLPKIYSIVNSMKGL